MIGPVVAHIRIKIAHEIEQVKMICEITTSAAGKSRHNAVYITLVLFTILALHVRALTVANIVGNDNGSACTSSHQIASQEDPQ